MNGKLIHTIYFYVVSFMALVILVIGIFKSVNYGVNVSQFSKYPLPYSQPCDFGPYPMKAPGVMGEPGASVSAEELKLQKEQCLTNQETESKKQQIHDLRDALAFTLIGGLLFALHFPVALRKSKS